MNSGIIIIVVSVFWLGSEIALARMRHSQQDDIQFDRSSLRVLWITIFASVNIGVLVGLQHVGYFGNGLRIFPLIGLMLVLCGLIIRWVAILTLKRQFTVDVAITKGHRIVNSGIYRYIRHPAYLGSLLSFSGLALFFANYLSICIIVVPICLAFLHRITLEEKTLVNAFGDEYTHYCASTKRLIPGVF